MKSEKLKTFFLMYCSKGLKKKKEWIVVPFFVFFPNHNGKPIPTSRGHHKVEAQ
jgi:hypothetical protein